MNIPTKEQTDEMMDRMAKGMTTAGDADLFKRWMCTLWEMQRKRMHSGKMDPTPLEDYEDNNWKEHAARIARERSSDKKY